MIPTELLLGAAFAFGTSFGLILGVAIENLVDYQLKKERQQMNFKIDKITWQSNKDKG
ncbi:hypothetical protein [Bacillus wiedmannii]|uniref:hypothetical protein n=1 Tax=Bacillus wiedmannii TaxID=1890302 RepID=UPI00159B8848|nr:hypothetical protein [Bacillus wiedmannii]